MAEEENVFVGTNCQSFDPSKVQCDKEGNMPIHIQISIVKKMILDIIYIL